MKAIDFHPEARAELDAAMAWYEQQRSGLGSDLLAEVEAAVARIQQNPQAFPQHNLQDVRKCLVKRFPYTIYYREFDANIWIAAVAHQKRKPGYWSARTP